MFGSSVRPRIMEQLMLEVQRSRLETARIIKVDRDLEASKARLSDGRRRPPGARHERRDKRSTIMWRRLRSGPVIIAFEAKRCLGEVFFVRIVVSDRE